MNQPALQRILAALAGKSLLRVISTPDRYDLHELLRQFAAEKLAETPDEETVVCDRHSAYYCAFLHAHTEHWHNARQLEALAEVTREADNAQSAWRWALGQEAWLRLDEAIDSWCRYHEWRGLTSAGEAFCQAVCDGVEQWVTTKPVDTAAGYRLWARAMAWYGEFAMAIPMAIQRFQQGLTLLARPELAGEDTRPIEAFTLLRLGIRLRVINPQNARSCLEESLPLYEAIQDSWGIGTALGFISSLDWRKGDYALAQQRAEAGLDIHQKQGDLAAQATILVLLGFIYHHLGQPAEAEQSQYQALNLLRQLGNWNQLSTMGNLAFTLIFQGKFDEGMELGQEDLHLSLESAAPMDEGFARLAIGWSYLHRGQYEQAQQELTHSLTLVRAENNPYLEVSVLCTLGYVALANLNYDEAQAAFEEGYRLNQTIQFNAYTFNVLSGLGFATCFRGALDQSRRHFIELLTEGLRRKDFLYLLFALPGLALYLARRGEVERATTVWAQAQCYPFVANSKWYEDVVGRELEALAASLPPEVAEAARACGRTLDLWAAAAELLAFLENKN
jgi:tetratricopeptide (TPR) repeat protein